jgi:phosphogluconate dehydratase
VLAARTAAQAPVSKPGFGREMYAHMRAAVGPADQGASSLYARL